MTKSKTLVQKTPNFDELSAAIAIEETFVATEKSLDQVFEGALRSNPQFVHWFLGRTKQGAQFPEYVDSRCNHPWGKVRLIVPNPETGALEAVAREGETDVLATFEGPDKVRLGLHIENKLAGGAFTPFQPEGYAARAEHWRRNPDYWDYDVWEMVLIAPVAFYTKHTVQARKFTTFISHEDIAVHLPAFAIK